MSLDSFFAWFVRPFVTFLKFNKLHHLLSPDVTRAKEISLRHETDVFSPKLWNIKVIAGYKFLRSRIFLRPETYVALYLFESIHRSWDVAEINIVPSIVELKWALIKEVGDKIRERGYLM